MRRLATRRLASLFSAFALLVGLLTVFSPVAQAAETADWLPFQINNGVVEVGCTWPPNGCGLPNHTDAQKGIDFILPVGKAVYAAGSGVVHATSGNCTSCDSRGRYVELAHPDGRHSRYLHLSSVTKATGNAINRGDLIGYSGDTMANGVPHLHYDETINGTKVDPGGMTARHGNTLVQYPNVLGYSSWNQVPAWSDKFVYNDSYNGLPSAGGGSDIDQNGAADLILTTQEAGGTIGVMPALSTWLNFMSPTMWWRDYRFGWSGVTPVVGDVNGDHIADYIFVTDEPAGAKKIWVARSSGRGLYAPELWWDGTGYGYGTVKVSLGDMDYNGADDVVLTAARSTGGVMIVVLRSTWQSFLSPVVWWEDNGFAWANSTPMVGNLNGSLGAADDYLLLHGEPGATKAWVLRSSGQGLYPPELWWNGVGYGYANIKPTLGDLDYNGADDLVMVTPSATGGIDIHVSLSSWQGLLLPALWWSDSSFGWGGVTPFAGNVNGNLGLADDVMFLTDEGPGGTKAWVTRSSGQGLYPPELWWNGVGYGYNGIKASLN